MFGGNRRATRHAAGQCSYNCDSVIVWHSPYGWGPVRFVLYSLTAAWPAGVASWLHSRRARRVPCGGIIDGEAIHEQHILWILDSLGDFAQLLGCYVDQNFWFFVDIGHGDAFRQVRYRHGWHSRHDKRALLDDLAGLACQGNIHGGRSSRVFQAESDHDPKNGVGKQADDILEQRSNHHVCGNYLSHNQYGIWSDVNN
jgi:hypothetical protein